MSASYFLVDFLLHPKSLLGVLHMRGHFQTTVVATPQSGPDQTRISSTWKHKKYYGPCPMMAVEPDGRRRPRFSQESQKVQHNVGLTFLLSQTNEHHSSVILSRTHARPLGTPVPSALCLHSSSADPTLPVSFP